MFKYINPGYGELLTLTPGQTVHNGAINPINGVGFKNENRSGNVVLPEGIHEVWVRVDVYFVPDPDTGHYTDNYNRVYVGNADHINTGVYQDSPTVFGTQNLGNTDLKAINISNIQDGKPHTIGLHVSAYKNYDNSYMDIYLDGQRVAHDTTASNGYMCGADDIRWVMFMGGPNTYYSNIIIADYDILNEKVIELPVKNEEGTFIVQSDGTKKAAEVGQELSATLDYSAIDKSILTSMTLGKITSVGVSSLGFSHDSSKVNSMESNIEAKDGTNLGKVQNLITTNEGAVGTVVSKTFDLSEIAGIKVRIKAIHL